MQPISFIPSTRGWRLVPDLLEGTTTGHLTELIHVISKARMFR